MNKFLTTALLLLTTITGCAMASGTDETDEPLATTSDRKTEAMQYYGYCLLSPTTGLTNGTCSGGINLCGTTPSCPVGAAPIHQQTIPVCGLYRATDTGRRCLGAQ